MIGKEFVRKMRNGRIIEEIYARGHENITAKHRTTLEITRDKELTPRGDCIVGVKAEKSVRDLNQEVKSRIRNGAELKLSLILPDYNEKIEFRAYGDKNLDLSHPSDVVIRKSTYTCPRTLAVRSEISASEINRDFVELLKDRKTVIVLRIEV